MVLSPFGGRSQTPPEEASSRACADHRNGARTWQARSRPSKQGSYVEATTPDADSLAAMGTNQIDPATRIPAASAGFAQGKQEATRVTFL